MIDLSVIMMTLGVMNTKTVMVLVRVEETMSETDIMTHLSYCL